VTSAEITRLFTEKRRTYERFVHAVGYPQGIRAFFRGSPLLRTGLRVLDAGCGTGIVMLALRDALVRRDLAPASLQAFDLTPAMLQRFQEKLHTRRIDDIETRQADVLDLGALPPTWSRYDLIVSASMLEYVPHDRLVDALGGLRARLAADGTFALFITRRDWLTYPLIGRWWRSQRYAAAEIADALRRAGFSRVTFRSFPPAFRYLALWGHVIEAGSD
jgi:2-polyprenyl-3-methyl-5-hydroxy-6-metoxy-1,4-benzoquinol methylase